MRGLRFIFICLLMISSTSHAVEKCKDSKYRNRCEDTKLGKLDWMSPPAAEKYARVLLNGTEIYRVKASSISIAISDTEYGLELEEGDPISKIILVYTRTEPRTCDETSHQYKAYIYLDFRGEKPVISNEFEPPTCYDARFDWVSWGKKNTVIGFRDRSRFKYENGHVTMIDDGSKARTKARSEQ